MAHLDSKSKLNVVKGENNITSLKFSEAQMNVLSVGSILEKTKTAK